MFNKAKRIQELPPYLFAEIDRKKRAAMAKGVDLIDLGIGDPDIPTPGRIIERLSETATKPANHRYPSSSGMMEFRQAVADWYDRRFGVTLDAATEVVSLIGSKEGVANMAVAYVDPGDVVLVPTPAYPVYAIGTRFNGGEVHFLPLTRDNGFLPDVKVAEPTDQTHTVQLTCFFLESADQKHFPVVGFKLFCRNIWFLCGFSRSHCGDLPLSDR